MTANELLVHLLQRQQESFLNMVAKVPPDKRGWVPQDGLRSALDQYQEVATILEWTWTVYTERRLVWDQASFGAYQQERTRLATFEECEAELRRQTAKLVEFVRLLPADELKAPVEVPWPEPMNLADAVHYHAWNMAYHEGQISLLLQMLGVDPMG